MGLNLKCQFALQSADTVVHVASDNCYTAVPLHMTCEHDALCRSRTCERSCPIENRHWRLRWSVVLRCPLSKAASMEKFIPGDFCKVRRRPVTRVPSPVRLRNAIPFPFSRRRLFGSVPLTMFSGRFIQGQIRRIFRCHLGVYSFSRARSFVYHKVEIFAKCGVCQ